MNPERCYYSSHENIHGEPVQRTPKEYPNSYDHYCIYKSVDFNETTDTVYSDRMWQWNPEKFDACHVRVWDDLGQRFDCRKPELVEQFLQAYYGISLDLTGIEAGCNFSNGNPYWVFYFKRNESYRDNHLELNDEDRAALVRKEELEEESFQFWEQFK